uniref:B30.2/SPRY domain-containing protein n=1 Tax=Hucho hucho TaxID=62062 RepID=A0A4W5KQR0_9TELE
MKRKGWGDDSNIGDNRKSWCLVSSHSGYHCSARGYLFNHAGVRRTIPRPDSKRVGVFLDWPAGTLSFYSVSSSGTLTHLHTEHTTFTEPLYPGFRICSSSVTLCQIDDQHIQRDHGGECRLKLGRRKYACHLTLDPDTAHPNLILSEGNRKVTLVEENQHYEDHPDRFDCHPHILCREGLSGSRYYWEVERDCGMAVIGVVYKGMKRKGWGDDSNIGDNRKSWCLVSSHSG